VRALVRSLSNEPILSHWELKTSEKPSICREKISALGRTRTCGLLIRRHHPSRTVADTAGQGGTKPRIYQGFGILEQTGSGIVGHPIAVRLRSERALVLRSLGTNISSYSCIINSGSVSPGSNPGPAALRFPCKEWENKRGLVIGWIVLHQLLHQRATPKLRNCLNSRSTPS
jgi:hypothetical protein